MPLLKGDAAKKPSGFRENIRREINAGKARKQAVAISYSQAGESVSKRAHKADVPKKAQKEKRK